jgi:hypothetical protein
LKTPPGANPLKIGFRSVVISNQGQRLLVTSSVRKSRRGAAFILNRLEVARPMGVRPAILPAGPGNTRNNSQRAAESAFAGPRPSGLVCEQRAGSGLQDGDEVAGPDVGVVFGLFLRGQRA